MFSFWLPEPCSPKPGQDRGLFPGQESTAQASRMDGQRPQRPQPEERAITGREQAQAAGVLGGCAGLRTVCGAALQAVVGAWWALGKKMLSIATQEVPPPRVERFRGEAKWGGTEVPPRSLESQRG